MNPIFSVQHHELFAILAAMLPICTKRTTVDTTATLLIQVRQKELIIKATDLEISLQASCMLEGREDASDDVVTFLVSGKRLHDIIKELDGLIQCTISQNLLTLKSNGVTVQLNMGSGDQFPAFPERIENLIQLEADILVEMLKGTAFIIPQQHSSNVLTGLFWELNTSGLTLTATDGHCLAQAITHKYSLSEARSWLIPRRAILELLKLIELMKEKAVFIGICGKHIVFSGAFFNFFTRLLTGAFPKYSSILQKDQFVPALVDRQQLVRTLRRATSLLAGQFIATQFQIEPEQVQVTMHNKDVGNLHEYIPVDKYEGEEFEIRFYAPYLLYGLNVFNDDRIKLYFKNPKQPLIVTSEHFTDVQKTYLIMPVAPANSGATES